MDVITRELLRGTSQPRFSADDLSDMGKQASRDYLCGVSSMNESIVKIAREKPGITAHHLQRVVEFANNETFQRLFEKQAGDKNIEFEVADPREVLRALDVEARPAAEVVSFDYGTDPTKLASDNRALEADLTLAEAFGVRLSSSSMQKVANGDEGEEEESGKSPSAKEKATIREWLAKQNKVSDEQFHEFAESMGLNVHRAEEAVYDMARDLAKKKTAEEIPGGKASGKPFSKYDPDQLKKGIEVEKEHSPSAAKAQEIAADHLEEFPDYYSRLAKMEHQAEKELKKKAMAFVKMAGANSEMVRSDLEKVASLESIKRASRGAGYDEENPHGELVRMRQTLVKTADDLSSAYSRNQGLLREAMDKLAFEVKQHMLAGGSLGEVVDAMGSVDDGQRVKEAMGYIVPELQKHGLNTTQARVDSIYYEMTKSAHRIINPNNPIVESFAALVKLADGQEKLHESVNTANELLKKADAQIARVARHS